MPQDNLIVPAIDRHAPAEGAASADGLRAGVPVSGAEVVRASLVIAAAKPSRLCLHDMAASHRAVAG